MIIRELKAKHIGWLSLNQMLIIIIITTIIHGGFDKEKRLTIRELNKDITIITEPDFEATLTKQQTQHLRSFMFHNRKLNQGVDKTLLLDKLGFSQT